MKRNSAVVFIRMPDSSGFGDYTEETSYGEDLYRQIFTEDAREEAERERVVSDA